MPLITLKHVPPACSLGARARLMPGMRTAGFSLVELMISIVVGLVVLGGVVSIFASSIKANSDALKMTGLNQELRDVMDLMTRDIRRAGYWGGPSGATTAIGPGTANANLFEALVINGSCITYLYDDDSSGTINTTDSKERRGFALIANAVAIRKDGSACGAGEWEKITDENSIKITALTFIPLDPPRAILINSDGTGTGTSTINVREIQITLTGELKDDATVSRELQERVRIRNDRWTP